MRPTIRTGRFDHRLNCTVIHHLPEGEVADGLPVIVFPQRNNAVTAGKTYQYTPRLTRRATYVVDDQTYRVAHALDLVPVQMDEGDAVDAILHRPRSHQSTTLGDAIGADSMSALAALRDQLSARPKKVDPLDLEYDFPVWGTQGGGLVREAGDGYIFVVKPDCPGLGIGDVMPGEWGIAPANQRARDSMHDIEVST